MESSLLKQIKKEPESLNEDKEYSQQVQPDNDGEEYILPDLLPPAESAKPKIEVKECSLAEECPDSPHSISETFLKLNDKWVNEYCSRSKKPNIQGCKGNNDTHDESIIPDIPKELHHSTPRVSYKCRECSEVFSSLYHLTTHYPCHKNKRCLTCSTCGLRFEHIRNLTLHKRSHKKLEWFVCSFCGKEYRKKAYFDKHVQRHT